MKTYNLVRLTIYAFRAGFLRSVGQALAIVILGIPAAAANTLPSSASLAWDRNPEADVAGYKIYWGEASRNYTRVLDVGNVPAATLTALEPGKSYHCAVTAYNAASRESAFSQEILVSIAAVDSGATDPSGRLVLLEAENGQLSAPMTIFTGPSESWVDSSSYSQLGWAKSTFQIPATGDYHIWCRVLAPTSATDSFFVSMDDQPEEVFHVYGTPTPPEATRSGSWIWRRIHVPDAGPRVHLLDKAAHSLRFRVREPGTLLDRVVLSSDPAFVPTDPLARAGDIISITRPPAHETRLTGQGASFTVMAAATGPVSYQWRKNGTVIPGATSAALAIGSLQPADSGDYTVVLTSGSATATTQPARLTVTDPDSPPVFRVTRMTFNADRAIAFELDGEPNTTVSVFASNDLVNWNLIGEQVNTTGIIQMADPAAASAPRRFYRLVSEAIPEE